ncbi:unnamed protein product [Owenia fusiformis]|uniref:Ribonuclease H2 subunit B n=1 Tax=Owenia fusiformis TaxID=6347 RepID=A0A8J1Y1J8_OWEFU|nr:unnamed protein product [Owenia fusiformis]
MSKKNGNRVVKDQNQWVFMLPDDVIKTDGNNDSKHALCKLKHPKTEKSAYYLFTNENTDSYEVIALKEDFRSWFIGQDVVQDGSVYTCTPVDPLFLVLPYMVNASKNDKYMQLDQIVRDENYPECTRLCTCSQGKDLKLIADIKGDDDLKVYRYNKERTLSWLKTKVEKTSKILEKKKIHVTRGAQCDTYVQATNTAQKDDYIRYAYGLISEYVHPELAKDLKDHLGIVDPVVTPDPEKPPPSKRAKLDKSEPAEDYFTGNTGLVKKETKKLTQAQKKLSKVDKSGMKSISSFFSPKSKTKK